MVYFEIEFSKQIKHHQKSACQKWGKSSRRHCELFSVK